MTTKPSAHNPFASSGGGEGGGGAFDAASSGTPSGPGGAASMATAERPTTTDLLRGALSTTVETEKLGVDTLEELEAQRDQLQRIQRKVDEVEAHADKSNFILNGMKSMFGSIKNKFSKKPEMPKQVIDKREAERAEKMEATDAALASKAAERDAKAAARAAVGTTPTAAAGGAGGPAVVVGAGKGGKVTDASLVKDPKLAAQMAEEDELLEQISRGLDGIKAVGHAMNDELIRQDGIIGELGTSMDRAGVKVDNVREAADKIAGR